MAPSEIVVDDFSPRISYTGRGWFNSRDDTSFYNGTQHFTNFTGSSIIFTFEGTTVTVLGSFSDRIASLTSQYSLDGGTPWAFIHPPAPQKLNRQVFYSASALRDGHHTLNVTTAGEDGQWFYFDNIRYTPSRRLSAGAIAGIAISCAVFVLAVAGVTAWMLLRRKRNNRPHAGTLHVKEIREEIDPVDMRESNDPSARVVAPFMEPLPTSSTAVHESNSDRDDSTYETAEETLRNYPEHHRVSISSSGRHSEKRRVRISMSSSSQPLSPRIHEDGGLRLAGGPSDEALEEELPPVYQLRR